MATDRLATRMDALNRTERCPVRVSGRDVHEKGREFVNEMSESSDGMTEGCVPDTSLDAAAVALFSPRPGDKLALNEFGQGSEHMSQETQT